jgi:hypothetical protein
MICVMLIYGRQDLVLLSYYDDFILSDDLILICMNIFK